MTFMQTLEYASLRCMDYCFMRCRAILCTPFGEKNHVIPIIMATAVYGLTVSGKM